MKKKIVYLEQTLIDYSIPSLSFHCCFSALFFSDFLLLSLLFLSRILFFCASTLISPLIRLSNFWTKISLAVFLFMSRERDWWHLTIKPVGLCLRFTALDVLFTACPPGPEPRTKSSSKSSSFSLGTCESSIVFFPLELTGVICVVRSNKEHINLNCCDNDILLYETVLFQEVPPLL